MAKKLPNLTGSGDTSYGPARVRSERAVVKGMMSDARQFGIRSPGKSVRTSHSTTKAKNRGNVGSFGKMKQSTRKSVNTHPVGY